MLQKRNERDVHQEEIERIEADLKRIQDQLDRTDESANFVVENTEYDH